SSASASVNFARSCDWTVRNSSLLRGLLSKRSDKTSSSGSMDGFLSLDEAISGVPSSQSKVIPQRRGSNGNPNSQVLQDGDPYAPVGAGKRSKNRCARGNGSNKKPFGSINHKPS